MNILRDFQFVILSPSANFITFSYKSFAHFLFKLLQNSKRREPEVALDFLGLTAVIEATPVIGDKQESCKFMNGC